MSRSIVIQDKDDEYYTPVKIIEYFKDFDYDPATTVSQAAIHNIPNFDTKETDGLKTDWTKYKKIWINPPFTLKKEFLEKAIKTYNQVKNDIYILLPINFLVSQTFHNLIKTCKIYIPIKRINFISNSNQKNKAYMGSVIIKLENNNSWEILKNE